LPAALAAPAIVNAQPARKWRCATSWPKSLPGPGVSAERLAQRITTMSNGALAIEVFAANTIVPPLAVFDAVSTGTIEMGHTASLFWVGKMPAAPLFCTVPFGLSPTHHMSWLARGGQQLWDELYAPAGVKAFVGGNTGPSAGGWFRREIKSLADIKGLRIRATGLSGEIYAALGATAIVIPPGETYAALERGVIDAVELLAPANDLPLGLHKIAPHYLFPGFNKPNGPSELLIGQKTWASLPAHLQAIIETACHAEHEIALAEAETANAAALKELVAAGAKPATFPIDVMTAARAAAGKAIERITATSPLAQRIVASYLETASAGATWDAMKGGRQ
jgi:TRAP-type mannitol/chloroaromatic compound transport system substrate-binding protein